MTNHEATTFRDTVRNVNEDKRSRPPPHFPIEMQQKLGRLPLQLYEMRQVDMEVVVNHSLADAESSSSELCFV